MNRYVVYLCPGQTAKFEAESCERDHKSNTIMFLRGGVVIASFNFAQFAGMIVNPETKAILQPLMACRHDFECEGWTVDPKTSRCRVCGFQFFFAPQPLDHPSNSTPPRDVNNNRHDESDQMTKTLE